ncbi:hypothetical protein [Spirosoma sp. 209]|uniref:hypothetical protein n=1 Tax=Spirosoma sp. 209 TaxID=1955701 RepID=UPI00111662C2|nr:hypothetical protein [Spirosoma sp. 209]
MKQALIVLGLAGLMQAALAKNELIDSVSYRSANALVTDMARLIRQHAYLNAITMVHRYDAWADTTQGCKLYIGEQIDLLGDPGEVEWYYIDFKQPIKANELKVVMGKNDNFILEASKSITKKIKRRVKNNQQLNQERNARLSILFLTDRKKRTVDFGQLQKQLSDIISQLIEN